MITVEFSLKISQSSRAIALHTMGRFASIAVVIAMVIADVVAEHSIPLPLSHLRVESTVAPRRGLQTANNDTVTCPSSSAVLAQKSFPVLITICSVQCAVDNLCIYFPTIATGECTTLNGRQCFQGSSCAFECLERPNDEMGWFLSLPAGSVNVGTTIALNASLIRNFVGPFNPTVQNDNLFLTGNEAANSINQRDVFSVDNKPFPRGEIAPFNVPTTFFENLQNVQRIKLENLRVDPPTASGSLSFPKLSDLYLRNTKLTSVPFVNASCPQLVRMDLSVNNISEVTQLPNASKLKQVNLSVNSITTIPKGVFSTSLIYLALDSNPLKEIPVGTLPPTLSTLTIGNTRLVEVPADIADMSALTNYHISMCGTFRHLSDNALKTIPDGSLPVEEMFVLRIDNCSLTAIPATIEPMTKLQRLWLDNNDLTTVSNFSMLPESIILLSMMNCNLRQGTIGSQLPAGLQLLDLAGNPLVIDSLTELPPTLLYLMLRENNLRRVPPVVATLLNLQGLNISMNPIEAIVPGELPSGLSQLWINGATFRSLAKGTLPSSITSFQMNNLLLEDAPEDVRSMEKLIWVHIIGGRLTTFDVADNLPVLSIVELAQNRLTYFSGSYPAATIMDLRDNRIVRFDVVSAPNLETPLLAGNNLTSMPSAIFGLPKLSILNLTGNPIREFAPTLAQLEFLAKILFVGMSQEMFVTNCTESEQARLRSFTVCTSTAPVEDAEATAPPSSSKTSIALILGNVGLAIVLVVLAYVWWRRRKLQKQREKDLSSQTASLEEQLLHDSVWTDTALLQHRLDATLVKTTKLLGSGVSGDVWLASYRNGQVAVKKLKHTDAVVMQQFVAEIKLVLTLSHPRIVEIVGVVWTKESDLSLVTEFMAGGDLRAFLDITPKLIDDGWSMQKLQIALEITEAVVYLHSLDPLVIHRDLKSRNVLLDKDGHAKVTDFGISRVLADDDATMTANIGTMRWIAPEILAGKRYTESADMYSLGIILCELDTHKLPFEDARDETSGEKLSDSTLAARLMNGSLLCELSLSCPREIRVLAQRCTAFEPLDRPTGLQIAFELRTLRRLA